MGTLETGVVVGAAVVVDEGAVVGVGLDDAGGGEVGGGDEVETGAGDGADVVATVLGEAADSSDDEHELANTTSPATIAETVRRAEEERLDEREVVIQDGTTGRPPPSSGPQPIVSRSPLNPATHPVQRGSTSRRTIADRIESSSFSVSTVQPAAPRTPRNAHEGSSLACCSRQTTTLPAQLAEVEPLLRLAWRERRGRIAEGELLELAVPGDELVDRLNAGAVVGTA